MSLDRQRVEAVKLLQEQGYTYSGGKWVRAKGALDAALVVKPAKLPPDAIQVYCEECGGTNVYQDGTIGWNVVEQDWTEPMGVFDNGGCNECGDGNLEEDRPINFGHCMKCHQEFHLDYLDAKPDPAQLAAGIPRDGCDFTRLECKECYGPGWCKGP